MTLHVRLSEVISSVSDLELQQLLTEMAAKYVCSDCNTADSDPYVGVLGEGTLCLYCPRCNTVKDTALLKGFTQKSLKGFTSN